jgi:hypothetical protein
VLLLLAYRLDAIPPPLSASALHKHDWEVQLMTSNLMLALGLLFAAYGLWRFVHWMKESAATPEEDSAETFPLTRDDFLPRGLQYGVYGLLLAGLLARPLAGLIWPERVSDIWGSLFMSIVVVVLLLFAAAGSVMRAPNHLDRALGPRYRWLEVSLCYLLLGNLALLKWRRSRSSFRAGLTPPCGAAGRGLRVGHARRVLLLASAEASSAGPPLADPFATSSQNSRVSRNASSA